MLKVWSIGSSIDWHPEDIKAAIRKTGISLAALARQHGLSASSGRKVLIQKSSRVQKIIADRLGLSPQSIWPSRYGGEGEACDRRRLVSPSNSPRAVVAKSKKGRRG